MIDISVIEKTIPGLLPEQYQKITELYTVESNLLKNEANERVAKVYNTIDSAILETFGVEKQGEKTVDYIKNAFSQKVKEFQKPVKDSGNEELEKLRAEKTKFSEILANKEKEWSEKHNKLESELNFTKTENQIINFVPKKFKYPDKLVQPFIKEAISEAVSKHKVISVDGETYLENAENFSRVKASEFFTSKLSEYIETSQPEPAKTNLNGSKQVGNAGLDFSLPANEFQQKLKSELVNKGLNPLDAKYQKEFSEKWQEYQKNK